MTQAAGAWTDRTQLEILRRLQIAKISGEKYFHPTNQISLQMWKTKLMKKDTFKTQSYDSPKHWWALSADIQICEETAPFSKFNKEKTKSPFTRTRISQLQPFAKDSSVHWFRTWGVSRFLTITAGSQYSQYGKNIGPGRSHQYRNCLTIDMGSASVLHLLPQFFESSTNNGCICFSEISQNKSNSVLSKQKTILKIVRSNNTRLCAGK